MVAQLFRLELTAADAAAQGGDQGADLLGGQHLVKARLLHVQDLAPKRQDGLGAPVPPLLGGAARRIPLHQVNLRLGRILLLAVRQLAGQSGDVEGALAARHLPRFAGRFPRLGGGDHLAHHRLGSLGVFVKIHA